MKADAERLSRKPERARVRAFFDTDEYLRANPNIAVRCLLVRTMLGQLEGCSILDVGCGDGSLSLQFADDAEHITLLDLSERMLERAQLRVPNQYRHRITVVNADILEFQPARSYDVVLCVGVLAHAGLVEATVARLSEALLPNGRCIVQISDCSRLSTRALYAYTRTRDAILRRSRYPLTLMTADDVEAAAAQHGLTLVDRRNYSFQFPGSGLLGERLRGRLERAALNHPAISSHGVQTMLLFVKDEHDPNTTIPSGNKTIGS